MRQAVFRRRDVIQWQKRDLGAKGKRMLAIYLSMLSRAADRKAFTALYESCKGRAEHLAYTITEDHALAEDAVHMGFCYLAEHYQELKTDAPGGLEAYLFDCVESRALDLLRQRNREHGGDGELMALESREAGAERQLIAAETLERAVAAIDGLKEIYRVTLTLHYKSGWSIQRIAEATGVSVPAAQKRLERARAQVLREVTDGDE